MINEYYILAETAGVKPMVKVYFENKELYLPLAVFGIKEHAIIKSNNDCICGKILNAQVCRISPKNVVSKTDLKKQLRLI